MVLDHLEIGGTVVELAFGILFGGIVLTLSLAIGLGSRDLVSRSLEKSADPRTNVHPFPDPGSEDPAARPTPPQPKPVETLQPLLEKKLLECQLLVVSRGFERGGGNSHPVGLFFN